MINSNTALKIQLTFEPLRNWLSAISMLLFAILMSCANRGTLEGGPKDTEPPRLDSLISTPNLQTHFKKQLITLAFDEWVELRDVLTQVVISPPLEFRPTIERRKKAIVVEFDEKEKLRDSATYVINFGQSIVDLTEGNPAPVVFVFSTGNYIDSLSFKAKVVDANSGLPVEGVLVMLYENLADSVVFTERPFYFGRTDKQGMVLVNNVKAGNFKVVAIQDQNRNYRFERESEKIAFLDSTVSMTFIPVQMPADSTQNDTSYVPPPEEELVGDTSLQNLDTLKLPAGPVYVLRLFEEEKSLFLRQKETTRYGLVKLGFSRPPIDVNLRFDAVAKIELLETEKDTLNIWYTLPADTSWQIFLERDSISDTIPVPARLKTVFPGSIRLIAIASTTGNPAKIAPSDEYLINFNHPLASVDPQKVELSRDTLKVTAGFQLSIDTLSKRIMRTRYLWKEGGLHTIRILPGGVTDIFGLANQDTISRTFTVGQTKEYGSLTLQLTNLDTSRQYFVRLLTANQLLVKSWKVSGIPVFQLSIAQLDPGIYTIEVTEDGDRNGRWTTGHYMLKRQPERVFKQALDQLRGNWELVKELEVKFE